MNDHTVAYRHSKILNPIAFTGKVLCRLDSAGDVGQRVGPNYVSVRADAGNGSLARPHDPEEAHFVCTGTRRSGHEDDHHEADERQRTKGYSTKLQERKRIFSHMLHPKVDG